MSWNGDPITLLELTEDFDERSGFVVVERYTGPEQSLRDFAASKRAGGWKTSFRKSDGGKLELSVRSADPNGPDTAGDTAVDEWQITTQFEQISVWSDENLRKYLRDWDVPSSPYSTPAEMEAVLTHYQSQANKFLKQGHDEDGMPIKGKEGPTPSAWIDPNTPGGVSMTGDEKDFFRVFYQQLATGMTKSQAKRVTLVRRRAMKIWSVHQFSVESSQEAWTRAALIGNTDFAVPSQLALKLPAEPNNDRTPEGFRWAWALQGQEVNYQGQKAVEVITWVYAPVRIFTFDIHT